MPVSAPPDFVERQFIGDPGGSSELQGMMIDSVRARGALWCRITYLAEKDQLVVEGWRVRPDDDGPEPT